MKDEPEEVFESAELPCVICGKPVFQRTSRRKRFCSKACAAKLWRKRNPGPQPRAHRSHYSVTITYTDAAGEMLTRVGVGDMRSVAQEDARRQLPHDFHPERQYTSTIQSIERSLRLTAE